MAKKGVKAGSAGGDRILLWELWQQTHPYQFHAILLERMTPTGR